MSTPPVCADVANVLFPQMSSGSGSLPRRSLPVVLPDATYRNPWPFKEVGFTDVIKWKAFGAKSAAHFPKPEEAQVLLPTEANINFDALQRFETHLHKSCDSSTLTESWLGSAALAEDRRGRLSVTWCSHSAFVVQVGGLTFLTDPVWADRASPVQFAGPKRMVPVPIPIESLPHIDVVMISHNHYDHLDAAAVKRLAELFDPIFLVPMGMKKWWTCRLWGGCGKKSAEGSPGLDAARVIELSWWDEVTIAFAADASARTNGILKRSRVVVIEHAHSMSYDGIETLPLRPDGSAHYSLARVACVPVQHWSMRTGTDRWHELWCGFVARVSLLSSPSTCLHRSFFHCGDTGYCPSFVEIGENFSQTNSSFSTDRRFGIDVAMIPIGAYLPRDVMKPQHVDPAEAVQIHDDIKAKYSVGMHWGTFILTDEAIDEPPRLLKEAMSRLQQDRTQKGIPQVKNTEKEFVALKHGETMWYSAEELDLQ